MIETRYPIENSERWIFIEVPLKLIDLHNYKNNYVVDFSNRTLRMNRGVNLEKILDHLGFLVVDYNKGISKYYLKIKIKCKASYYKKLSREDIVNGMTYINLINKEYIKFIKKKFENLSYNLNQLEEIQILSKVLNKIFNDNEKSINMTVNDYLTLNLSKKLLNQFLWNS